MPLSYIFWIITDQNIPIYVLALLIHAVNVLQIQIISTPTSYVKKCALKFTFNFEFEPQLVYH